MIGHIKLEKKITQWEYYKDLSIKSVFIHFLLTANYKDSFFGNKPVLRGQLVSGRTSLSKELGLTEKQVRRCLLKLEKSGEIKIERANKYSIITICKYDDYQSQRKAKGPTEGQQKGQQKGQQELEQKGQQELKGIVIDKLPISDCLLSVTDKVNGNTDLLKKEHVGQQEIQKRASEIDSKRATSIEVQEVKEEYIINNNTSHVNGIIKNNNINQEAAASRTQRSDFISLPDGKVIFNYDSLIPEKKLTDVIRYIKTIRGFDISIEKATDTWNIFRDLQINASKKYDSQEEGYSHFFNWAKIQPFTKERKAAAASVSKSVNGNKKKEDVVGVEFINDFTECRMSDGTIKKLNQNQSDQARYNQINPKAIK